MRNSLYKLVSICMLVFVFSSEAAFDQRHGAKGVAMGSAYTAVVNDLDSISWNPAGLTQIKKPTIAFASADLMDVGLNYSYLSTGLNHNDFGLGVALCRVEDTILPYKEESITFSGAKPFGTLSVGASLAFHRMDSVENGQGFSLSLGLLKNKILKGGDINFGLTANNLVSKLDFTTGSQEDIKRYFSFGVAYKKPDKYTASLELREDEINMGYEYNFSENLEARVGLNNGKLAGGFSVKVGIWSVDYAYLMREMGNENRISVSRHF